MNEEQLKDFEEYINTMFSYIYNNVVFTVSCFKNKYLTITYCVNGNHYDKDNFKEKVIAVSKEYFDTNPIKDEVIIRINDFVFYDIDFLYNSIRQDEDEEEQQINIKPKKHHIRLKKPIDKRTRHKCIDACIVSIFISVFIIYMFMLRSWF